MIPVDVVNSDKKRLTNEWLGSVAYNANRIKLKKTKNPRLVVSFTSWKKRIDYCTVLIKDILAKQTLQPDYIFVVLSDGAFPRYYDDLPKELTEVLNNPKVKLVWNGNIDVKSMKKMLPILPLLNDDDIIISLDDDNYDRLPADMFESRVNDIKKFNRPITYNSPIMNECIWMNGSSCPTYRKYMLNGWDGLLDDDFLMSGNEDGFVSRVAAINGYYPITASKYAGIPAEDHQFNIIDDLSGTVNNDFNLKAPVNNLINEMLTDGKAYYQLNDFANIDIVNHYKQSLSTDFVIPIALCECNQVRCDNSLYNMLKSLIITNHFVYTLDITIFFMDYINSAKIESLLTAYNVKYKIIREADIEKQLKIVKTCELYSGPYLKIALYDYMKDKDWYLMLDDDLIFMSPLYKSLFTEFLNSGKAFGLCDDYQYREVAPVLYDKYGLEKEYNTGVVLVNNKYMPKDFLKQFKKINNDYYRKNPDMPRNMCEQTPLNILFKDSIFEMPDDMNFKPISIKKCPEPYFGITILHYAGLDKNALIENPDATDYGWAYKKCSMFKMLNETDEFVQDSEH